MFSGGAQTYTITVREPWYSVIKRGDKKINSGALAKIVMENKNTSLKIEPKKRRLYKIFYSKKKFKQYVDYESPDLRLGLFVLC